MERNTREYERERMRRRKAAMRKRILRRKLFGAVITGIVLVFSIRGALNIRAEHRKEEDVEKIQAQKEAQEAQEQQKKEKKEAKREKEEADMVTLMEGLQEKTESLTADYDGEWSIYIKEMSFGNEIVLGNESMYPASLIKLYVMAATFENIDQILECETERLGDKDRAFEEIKTLLKNMIELSDNESYNELVRLQSPDRDFVEGCNIINEYLEENGYEGTGVHTTIHPSQSAKAQDGLGDNETCVKDCGNLLSEIYNGMCVSQEASGFMLDLLLNQERRNKIPDSFDSSVKVVNKTGETSEEQHDAAIVYGEKTDFILCIMVKDFSDTAEVIEDYHELSKMIYKSLND